MDRDPLLWNKIVGAVLAALLIASLSGFAVELLYGAEHAEQEEVALALVSIGSSASEESSAVDAEPVVPLANLLALADVERGKNLSRKCVSCHTFTPNGANRIGPNLWSLLGRSVASVSGFRYSEAMKSFGGSWSEERLAAFIQNPKGEIAGTKMNFVGIKKAQDRADIIAWLRTLK